MAGVHPDVMGIGPVPAVRKALERAGLAVADLDVVELNEAFASQSVACMDELGLDPARVNPNGGAIALGHPLGASGARLVTMLVHELARTGGRYGLAAMCIGVGQGIATIVERVETVAAADRRHGPPRVLGDGSTVRIAPCRAPATRAVLAAAIANQVCRDFGGGAGRNPLRCVRSHCARTRSGAEPATPEGDRSMIDPR